VIDILELVQRLRAAGYADDDIAWAESLTEPTNATDFALEIIFVICNSGMRFTVARGIYDRVRFALLHGGSATTAFGHAGKANAINYVWRLKHSLFGDYFAAADKLAFIEALPWIGGITKYHVAKNFGLPYAKPDVHLERLARTFDTTPQALCEELAKASGYKVATIDTLLWRAAAIGILDTRTGVLR
jgi:hypothetical protein